MIRGFADRDTERLFDRERPGRLPGSILRSALRKLRMLHAAQSLADLAALPGNRLEKLVGDRRGQHSIRVNDQWRVCFTWLDGDAYDVEIVDYH
jgi:proteic killer suppression protein